MLSGRSCACAILASGVLAVPAGGAAAAPPKQFFGVQAWNSPSAREFKKISAAGIGTFRVNITWAAVEPERGARNWEPVDSDLARINRAGLRPLPVILGSPKFAAPTSTYPPRSNARRAYAAFVRDLVARYGPEGEFWDENPSLAYRPVRAWQVWNEPSFAPYWNGRPNAREYVSFVRQTRTAIKSSDPGAGIVLAGLPDTEYQGKRNLLPYIRSIYRVRGASELFDVVALNAYAKDARSVVGVVRRVRGEMNRAGDRRTPIWVTETGWGSGGDGNNVLTRTPSVQASLLRSVYRALIAVRSRYRIGLVAWFSLRDRKPGAGEPNWWAIHTGLFDRAGREKPAWRAYRSITGR